MSSRGQVTYFRIGGFLLATGCLFCSSDKSKLGTLHAGSSPFVPTISVAVRVKGLGSSCSFSLSFATSVFVGEQFQAFLVFFSLGQMLGKILCLD